MRIKTSHLEALRWISRTGSFRAAATQLSISQPTISMRIREFEELLGAQLFDRHSYRARLTPRGREAVKLADRFLVLTSEIEQQLMGHGTLERVVRIGASETLAFTCLPALSSQLEHLLPALQVDLQIDYSINLNHRLHGGELDLAFLSAPTPGPLVVIEPLVEEEFVWVASPRMHLPNRTLRPRDLSSWPIITNPRPSYLFDIVWRWFKDGGEEPKRLNTCNSLTIMAHMATAGFGLALLPIAIVRNDLKRGILVELTSDPKIRPEQFCIAYRTDIPTDIIEKVRAATHDLVLSSPLMLPA